MTRMSRVTGECQDSIVYISNTKTYDSLWGLEAKSAGGPGGEDVCELM